MSLRLRPEVELLTARVLPAVFGIPWPTANLTLSFVPDGSDVNGVPSQLSDTFAGIPTEVWQGEILRAFQTWAAVANINIGVVPDGGQSLGAPGSPQGDVRFGDIRIAAVPLAPNAAAVAAPFDVSAGTRSGDVWFNAALPFSVGGAAGADIYTVALHEAGHVLGIAESEDPTSALFDEAVTRSGPNANDVAAAVALYGPRKADAFDAKGTNEALKTATPTQVGSGPGSSASANLVADIATPNDVDTYVFQPSNLRGAGLTASVRVGGYSGLVPKLEILDATGRVVASGRGTAPGTGDVLLHLDAPVSGATYYARVTAARSDVFGVGGYKLELRPDAASDGGSGSPQLVNADAGGNDTLKTASQLGQQFQSAIPNHAGYNLAASLHSSTDVDFYRLKTPQTPGNAPVTMTVTVSTTPPGGTDPVVDVYDPRGVKVAARVLVHDGGAYTVQVLSAQPNADYYVAVRHARPGGTALPGNYTLNIDFGTPPAEFADFMTGTLTAAAPLSAGLFAVNQPQVLHLVFDLSQNASAVVAGARFTVLDAGGNVVESRFVSAGDAASANLFLRPGVYTVLAGGGAVDGSALAALRFVIRGLTLSDPIGPQPVSTVTQPAGAPAPAPAPAAPAPAPVVWSPTTLAPVVPVAPSGPAWWLAPPTDWAPANWVALTTTLFTLGETTRP